MHLNSLLAVALTQLVQAQFPPPREGVKYVQSKHHENITISYKNPHICETTPGVKQYSGYLHLPPNSVNETGESQNFPINTFFWFIESRKDPHHAPLSIWLNGGPGGSSLLGMLAENGPCSVNNDSNSTTLNPWSWNNEVNMLFIDQPVQVGYSYDSLNNGTYNITLEDAMDDTFEHTPIELRDFSDGDIPEQTPSFLVGTFASQNLTNTQNSTEHAAVALWHFAQTWFEEFPKYKPHDEKISLWAESYGGHYGPKFFDFFYRQNEKITNGTISGPGTHYLHLDTLGLVNACIDDKVQNPSYSYQSWNNTYGLVGVNETTIHRQLYELGRPGGITDQVAECQRMTKALETKEFENATYVDQLCTNASVNAATILVAPYMETGKHGWFDVTHPAIDPFPYNYMLGYLNQHWVQQALGVPINHTWVSMTVAKAFTTAADMPRGGELEALAHLLDNGVKVHLMYGDRDFACNWIGGEAASLAIPHKHAAEFASAGFTAMIVSPPTEAPFVPYGLTRQHGNLSFTRVFQAGHMVPSYQPEASYKIFARSLFNKDIATGAVDLTATGGWAGVAEDEPIFKTEGPGDTWWRRNEVMPVPPYQCYVFSPGTCSKEDKARIANGTAVIKDWIVQDGVANAGATTTTGLGRAGSDPVGEAERQTVLGVEEL